MATLQGTDMADLVLSVINDKGRMKYTDLRTTYQNTYILKRFLNPKKGNSKFLSGGTEFEFNLMTGVNDSARGVGLYFQADRNASNVMTSGKMPWRQCTANYIFDGIEVSMNGSVDKVFDLIQTKRMACLGSLAKYFEQKGWRCPSSTNTTDFHGIPYFVVKSNTATTTNDGFNGGAPSGYTLVANINPSNISDGKWNNYAAQYTSITKEDLVDKWWRAASFTDFEPLTEGVKDYNEGDDYGFYTTYSVQNVMKTILESQNDNLGSDLDSQNGKMRFRGANIYWVKELDSDTTNPVYGINWGVFGCRILRGWWNKERIIRDNPNQPTVTSVDMISSFNFICLDRRRNFVLATDTTMPA